MDVREKLVELLSEKCMETCKQRKGYVCSVEECRRCKEKCCGFYADHLIANGVTVQEWISQTELPWMGEEIAKLCIRYMEDYADFHGYASSQKVKAHIVRLLELEKGGRIAILPQPPKGE